jgi:anthraniloyl-CoA monooxygenase
MRINIIGGGPAGLYFAILMKQSDPSRQIAVWERNAPDDTFGWGVVFSGRTLANLREADPISHAEISESFAAWDNVDVVHRDAKISIHGNSFSGIARIQLLKILQQRCDSLGVELRFRSEVSDIDALRQDCDLLVAADGVNSGVRLRYHTDFQPTLTAGDNRYIWYGTHQLFHGLTLTFRERAGSHFAAHSYKFNSNTSTFIVECDAASWEQSGFDKLNDEQTRTYLEEVFAVDLAGQKLLSNNSKWINFLLVKNQRWFVDNVVLLGDALHTAHFSIGSGTKLAMEDSIALQRCFATNDDVPAALAEFERVRRPVIEDYQAAAYESMIWFEHARDYSSLTPLQLAYSVMTRSGRVTDSALRARDPEFMAAYENEKSNAEE